MYDVIRAGWLMKRTSILKTWKKKWFSLTSDGFFRCFENEDKPIAEHTLFMPDDVTEIKVGASNKTPPEGHSKDNILEIKGKDKGDWILCADSLDDMITWQLVLEEIRHVNRPQRQMSQEPPQYILDALQQNPNGGYPMYYRGNYNGIYPSTLVQTPQGPVHIVFVDRNHYYPRRSSSNVALGALTGYALASTLFLPFWWPLFWF